MVNDSHKMRMAKPPSSKLLTSYYCSTTYKGELTTELGAYPSLLAYEESDHNTIQML
jgi:hypothetical protein